MNELPAAWIDTHAHIFEPGLPAVAGARYVPKYAAPLNRYLAVLAANGVARGVLVQPSFLGSDNSYLLAALASAPAVLRGVVVVSPDRVDADLSPERVRDLNAAGVRGVRLNLIGQPLPDLFRPEWKAAGQSMARHGWHLEVQASGTQWSALAAALSNWPSKIVIDHLGLPHAENPKAIHSVLQLFSQAHVWVKVSGPYRSSPQEAADMFARLVKAGSTDRLVFGSDWPFTRHEDQTYASILEWGRTLAGEELFDRMMTTNAQTLFGWVEPTSCRRAEPALQGPCD